MNNIPSRTLFCLPWLEEDISVTLKEGSQMSIEGVKGGSGVGVCVCARLSH